MEIAMFFILGAAVGRLTGMLSSNREIAVEKEHASFYQEKCAQLTEENKLLRMTTFRLNPPDDFEVSRG